MFGFFTANGAGFAMLALGIYSRGCGSFSLDFILAVTASAPSRLDEVTVFDPIQNTFYAVGVNNAVVPADARRFEHILLYRTENTLLFREYRA